MSLDMQRTGQAAASQTGLAILCCLAGPWARPGAAHALPGAGRQGGGVLKAPLQPVYLLVQLCDALQPRLQLLALLVRQLDAL